MPMHLHCICIRDGVGMGHIPSKFFRVTTCLHLREEIKQEIQAKIKSNKKTTIPAVPGQREDISQNREAAVVAAAAAAAHKVTKVV